MDWHFKSKTRKTSFGMAATEKINSTNINVNNSLHIKRRIKPNKKQLQMIFFGSAVIESGAKVKNVGFCKHYFAFNCLYIVFDV